MLRAKIAGCIARGGTPDPDCPNDEKSYRYWAYTGASQSTVDENEATSQVRGKVSAADAIQALAFGPAPVAGLGAPPADPVHMARTAIADAAHAGQPGHGCFHVMVCCLQVGLGDKGRPKQSPTLKTKAAGEVEVQVARAAHRMRLSALELRKRL